jgi:hypothetical protein
MNLCIFISLGEILRNRTSVFSGTKIATSLQDHKSTCEDQFDHVFFSSVGHNKKKY